MGELKEGEGIENGGSLRCRDGSGLGLIGDSSANSCHLKR